MAEVSNVKTETTKIVQDEAYPIQDLIENCEALTGCKMEVAVGALFGCEKEQMSKKEFKETVKNFLRKKVK